MVGYLSVKFGVFGALFYRDLTKKRYYIFLFFISILLITLIVVCIYVYSIAAIISCLCAKFQVHRVLS